MGIGVRIGYNVTERVALEMVVNFFPGFEDRRRLEEPMVMGGEGRTALHEGGGLHEGQDRASQFHQRFPRQCE
ncbi:hypothetical protein HRbin10_01218 [bacterium HR10]|uniref:Uncharacterized protein n=1 Tax=uncultured Acidobacteriota bacterium TaxID=171953 RepID=H5SFW9_9BACT|nr:hypothetical protein HGMM_F22D11C32 [uncultured Acidobacteriota bacterium]GBC82097.1 hypothetical protein HRbin10_01218 [bacterium HR10]